MHVIKKLKADIRVMIFQRKDTVHCHILSMAVAVISLYYFLPNFCLDLQVMQTGQKLKKTQCLILTFSIFLIHVLSLECHGERQALSCLGKYTTRFSTTIP